MYSLVNLMLIAAVFPYFVSSTEPKKVDKYLNYIRLPEGECYNCSTYKCTDLKGNMGGSEWCILFFEDAIKHCDSDPNCGGYTMSTADWFHEKYDKNGQFAVHLNTAGEKTMPCPVAEWSSYEKQKTTRSTPIKYGQTTCESFRNDERCDQSQRLDYLFVSNSNVVDTAETYLCENHPKNLGNKTKNCILSMIDAIQLCNSDENCEGFFFDTNGNWQKNYSANGVQGVQLFRRGSVHAPNKTWRLFAKTTMRNLI